MDLVSLSESGSTAGFQPAVWEEQRSKRSLVKWAGEEQLQDLHDKTAGSGGLRRAPTPFPKEMRAMAKKAENIREKRRRVAEGPTASAIRKKVSHFISPAKSL